MPYIKLYLVELVGEPYFENKYWHQKVKVMCRYELIHEFTIRVQEKSELDEVSIGQVFYKKI